MIEQCHECGFDSAAYTDDDVQGSLRAVAPWWGLLTEGVADDVLHARPADGVWSAIEYGEHTAEVLRLLTFGLSWMLTDDNPVFPSVEPPPLSAPPSSASLADVSAALATAAAELGAQTAQVSAGLGARTATLGDGSAIDAAWLARHAVHDALHHLHDVGRNLVALGAGAAPHRGVVEQVSSSDGGVPKRAVPSAQVGPRGLEGDRQGTRRHHGRQWQALCLMSAEAIERMQAEGHPISFAAAGENITVRGIDWAALRPGNRVQIGGALCEVTVPALPCANNAQWFSDRDFMRMHHEHHRGETRWYASVVDGGTVCAGDDVVLEP